MLAAKPRPRRTRGGTQLPRVDGRFRSARRFRDLVRAFEAEVGGADLTEFERGLIVQAAGLQLRIENLEATLIEGGDVSSDEIIRLGSECRRILASLRERAGSTAGRGWRPSSPTDARSLARRSMSFAPTAHRPTILCFAVAEEEQQVDRSRLVRDI
jgi:hypothetical protein